MDGRYRVTSNSMLLAIGGAQALMLWVERRPVSLGRVIVPVWLLLSMATRSSDVSLWILLGAILAIRLSSRPSHAVAEVVTFTSVLTLVACLCGVIVGQFGDVNAWLVGAAAVLTAAGILARVIMASKIDRGIRST